MGTHVRTNNFLAAAILLAATAAFFPDAAAQTVVVPDVVGLQQGVAEPTILAAGLTIGNVTFEESFVVPVGQVMSQQPLAGTGALAGSPVNLVVSAGVVAAIVPSIVGLTRTQATAAILAAGLTVGTVVDQFNSSFPPDTVLSQNPPAGTSVASGTAVGFSVSIGAGTVSVPNVVGLQQAAAQVVLLGAGLTLGPIITLPSPTIPAGQVIAQQPGAGAVVDLGTQVNLTVSSGSLFVLVPSLIGLTQSAAVAAINAAGLELGAVTTRSSATVPAGFVISQTPVAGVAVSSGSTVDLIVSSGLTQTPVPNVIGLSLLAAEQAILLAGLSIGTITEQTNPAVPAGQVFNQSPAPGTLVPPGTSVNLTVSAGPGIVTVPNLIGLTQAAAQNAIVSAGLVVGTVTQQPSATAPPGTVILQVPPGGVSAVLGSAVDLVIATSLQQVVVPNVVGLTESAATSAILAANLTVGTIVRQQSSTVPAGQVISQSPSAGSLVFPNTAINLVISTGFGQAFVPNVVGLTSLAAQAAILGAGLTVGTIVQQANPLVPAGNVISQNPAAGNIVATGTPVNLVVSTGPTSVFVPNVVGLTLTAAQAAIINAGLAVGTITQQASTLPAGTVLSQNPPANSAAAPGSEVNLVISSGAGLVSVPNVVGLTRTAAETAITTAGLVVGDVTTRFSSTVPAGQVLEQDPLAGTSVAQGSAVDLVIATSTQNVLVPSVVGLPLPTATLTLTNAGLALGTVTERSSVTVPDNSVISQSPGAGSSVASGTRVNLVVSTGALQTTVPNLVGLTLAQAQLSITLAGFVVGNVAAVESSLPVNQVIAQSPPAGATAAPGSVINLTISAGIAPTTVPNLVGLSFVAAQQLIAQEGFTLGQVTQRPDPIAAEGTVLDQQPDAGVLAPAGAAINLIISQGLVLAEVPDVVGLQLDDAEEAIEDAGLVVGDIEQQQSTEPAGEVLSQFPLPGVEISAGAAIDLVVSQGPTPLPRPLNLTASQGTFSEFVRLTWDAVEGAIDYQILRSSTTDIDDAISLATVAETTYDDTEAAPPVIDTVSPGCFAPPEDVVDFAENYYWVQAVSADAESEFTGPELGYRGLAEPRELDMARVTALPARGVTGSMMHALPGDGFALRLSGFDAIEPSSVWGTLTIDGVEDTHTVQWRPTTEGAGRDGWVVLKPEVAFRPGQAVRFTAGARTSLGSTVMVTSEFLIRDDPLEGFDVSQPIVLDKFAADEARLSAAAPAGLLTADLPPLPEGVGPAYFIEPHEVYHTPQRLWLPAPDPFMPDDLELYVLITGPDGAEWWQARRVAGFALDAETAAADVNGVPHFGVLVRHGAVVRLGQKLPEPKASTTSQGYTDDIALAGVAIVSLIAAAIVGKRSH